MDFLADPRKKLMVQAQTEGSTRDKLLLVLIILVGVVAIMIAYSILMVDEPKATIMMNSGPDPMLTGANWSCTQVVCERLMTQQEWFDRFCTSDGAGSADCRFQTPQGILSVPISQLNLSAIRECAQYACVQESLVRYVNYSISPP